MKNEAMAMKIKGKLLDLCPAFRYEKGSGLVTWHGCKCLISGSSCDCVWHLTDTCKQGKWPQLKHVARRQQNINTKAQRLTKRVKLAMKE